MLLATKCPYCKTTFKVANDQLKLQSGLVRCGICNQVFNGIEHLAQADTAAASIKINTPEIPSEITPDLSDVPDQEVRTEPALPENHDANAALEADLFESFGINTDTAKVEPVLDMPNLVDTFFPVQPKKSEQADQTEVVPEIMEEIVLTEPGENFDTEVRAPRKIADPLMAAQPDEDIEDVLNELEEAQRSAAESAGDGELAQLLFIRQARTRRRMRWLLAVGTVLLMLTLTGQAAYQFRDYLAAAYPQSRTTLVMLCRLAHCQLTLPAQLDAISYEADELHTLPHENTFEFSLLMRNHSALPQAWPHIELTLKDPKKQVVLRRVFVPSEYLSSPREELAGFAAGQEQAVKLYFVVDKVKASDYVVSIFYP